jgi:hypothetical protein
MRYCLKLDVAKNTPYTFLDSSLLLNFSELFVNFLVFYITESVELKLERLWENSEQYAVSFKRDAVVGSEE